MWNKLIRTADDRTLTLLRVALGVVMFAHGAQKMLGWFGGAGLKGTLAMFDQYMGIPAPLSILVVIAEFFGSLGLIAGFLTRIGAAGIVAVMLGAVFLAHVKNGFFMNWSGQQAGEGFEYHVLVIAIASVLVLRGGGWASVDGRLQGRGRAPMTA